MMAKRIKTYADITTRPSSRTFEGTRERKKRFDAAHKKGMAALKRHDFAKVEEAVKEERAIIKEQAALLPSIPKPKKKAKKKR